MEKLKIGELSGRTGCPTQTIRFYETKGLLPVPSRSAGNYRLYGETHIQRLTFIRHCRGLDMTLDEIRSLLQFQDAPEGECGVVNVLLDEHLRHVGARIRELKALERQLTELRKCCGSRHAMTECGILHELVAAAHGEACVCHGGSEYPVQKV